jgi:hypothetical protein
MRKPIGLAAAIFFGLAATGAGSCSSSADLPIADAGGTHCCDTCKCPFYGPYPDADADEGDVACFDPSTVLSFTTAPLPPAANQGKCASDDLVSQFLAACIQVAADGGADAGDGGDACDVYLQTNPDCATCLGDFSAADAGAAPASPWPALLQIDQAGHTIPNVAACLAAISTGTDTCKSNYANDDLCLESGCGACAASDFSACAAAETTGQTSTCVTTNPLDSACQAALNAVSQTDADTKCAASTTINTDADFAAVFMTVGRTLCE